MKMQTDRMLNAAGCSLLAFLIVSVVFIVTGHCQNIPPLPLGAVTDNGPVVPCPSGFQNHATCESLTITACPGATDSSVIVGTVTGTNGKTVVYANGSTWEKPGGAAYMTPLSKFGYTTVTAEWPSGWQALGAGYTGNMLTAACRPATLFNWIANGHSIALLGGSAGAGAIGYALTWYGASALTAGAWLTSGPPYTYIDQGCETPKLGQIPVTDSHGYQWYSAVAYSSGVPMLMSSFTGITCEPKNGSTAAQDTAWLDQSPLAPGFQSYLAHSDGTPVHLYAQLCASTSGQPMNNSSGQGEMFLEAITSPWTMEGVLNCANNEGTETGVLESNSTKTGLQAFLADVEQNY